MQRSTIPRRIRRPRYGDLQTEGLFQRVDVLGKKRAAYRRALHEQRPDLRRVWICIEEASDVDRYT